ncbi:MAG: response regulator transcription factor [Actinobacteria bacterium]|nr:response regulator transcription factor [Actinomycetota bacterium]
MSLSEFSGRTVLVVDDEPMVREVVTTYLTRDGLDVTEAADGASALRAFEKSRPDLIVLDVMLPEIDGYSLLSEVRSRSNVPVIMLTARGEETDRVLGLELGADDYVVKPFSPRELAARVRAVLKRSDGARLESDSVIEIDELRIDPGAREVGVKGRIIEFTPKEFDLLVFLATHPRQVFSRSQLLEQVWDSNTSWQDPSTVTVHVRRIRQKIESNPDQPKRITTVWGVGYRFET